MFLPSDSQGSERREAVLVSGASSFIKKDSFQVTERGKTAEPSLPMALLICWPHLEMDCCGVRVPLRVECEEKTSQWGEF